MIALTITCPRPMLTPRTRTACTTPVSSSRTSPNSPERNAGTLMTTSTSSAPRCTASSAASALIRGVSAPKGNEMTVHVLTSVPLSSAGGERHEVREQADGGEVVPRRLGAERLDVRARRVGAQQRVIDGLGEFLGLHASTSGRLASDGLEPARV